ncbi:hypothetical protein AAF712_014638 [Marasmius tenuissimus]|uniref:Metallo-dependent hydrolase n=1 Tax=Marasmius tenuissimus TaxID=585030 RepID=A0ABR2ZE27_9AGAR
MYEGKQVDAIVDVWCEAPVQRLWKEFADSALTEEDRRVKWGGLEYWFVMGMHPHNAKEYTDDIEREILEAMTHTRCIGWGEMGLDYHYDNSPREIQRDMFACELRHAVQLGKPLTIHTREADNDTERILKEIVPQPDPHPLFHRHPRIRTSPLPFSQPLHWYNRYLPSLPSFPPPLPPSGVITFTTNLNTAQVVRQMFPSNPSDLRILLETDAPYMVPANIYASLSLLSGNRLPFSHSAMIPWTADFVSGVLKEKEKEGETDCWDSKKVLEVGRENARKVYGG